MVGLGRSLHEGDTPRGRFRLSLRPADLPDLGGLIALVGGQHHRDAGQFRALQLLDGAPDRPQLLQGLATADGVHEDERVSLKNYF